LLAPVRTLLALLSDLPTGFSCPAYRFRIGMGMNLPGGCRGGSMAEQSLRALQHILACPQEQIGDHPVPQAFP
jgi:hypothetical protein